MEGGNPGREGGRGREKVAKADIGRETEGEREGEGARGRIYMYSERERARARARARARVGERVTGRDMEGEGQTRREAATGREIEETSERGRDR